MEFENLPLFAKAFHTLKSDRSLIAEDLRRLDKELATIVYGRIINRREIKDDSLVRVGKPRQVPPVIPRGSSAEIPKFYKVAMAARPKPNTVNRVESVVKYALSTIMQLEGFVGGYVAGAIRLLALPRILQSACVS